ncbi:MAG: hypothetical protein OEY85_08900 [Rhodospirillales bacterium]|nr:hypothetical protein [Rhodospirillales bacterium]
MGDFRIGGDPRQLILPQIQVALRQLFQIRGVNHFLEPYSTGLNRYDGAKARNYAGKVGLKITFLHRSI